MKKKYYLIPLSLLLVLVSIQILGQNTSNISLRKITQTDGLSSYYITKIIQDRYGFLWIGTQEGLNRFDGTTFFSFTKQSEDKQSTGGSFISDIFEDTSRNIIWVTTSYGDVCGIDEKTNLVVKRITKDPLGTTFSKTWIRSLSVSNNILWIGTGNGLYTYDLLKDQYISVDTGGKPLNVAKIFPDNTGNIWVLCDDLGILIFDKLTHSPLKTYDARILNNLNSKTKLRFWDFGLSGDTIYLATSYGLKKLYTQKSQIDLIDFSITESLDNSEILSCHYDQSKTLWFSTSNGLYSYDTQQKLLFSYSGNKTDDADWFNMIYQVLCDDIGNIWIGTQEGLGNFSLTKYAFLPFSNLTLTGPKIKHTYSILPITDSVIYCGDENGFFRINAIQKTIQKIDTTGFILMLLKDRKKNIFVSNRKGLFLNENNTLKKASLSFPELDVLNYDILNSGIEFNDSIIIFGSVLQKGLSVWNKKSHTLSIYHNDSLKNFIKDLRVISNLYKSRNNTLFILTDKSIIEFDPISKKVRKHDVGPDLKLSNFMDMCETEDSYWLALYGNGLVETDKNFKPKKFITTKNRLCNDATYKIFSYRDSLIIVTTNNGLSVINCKSYQIKNYYESDGLHSNSFEQLCGISFNKKIFVGGINGFDIVNPEHFRTNPIPPKCYFTRIGIKTKNGSLDTTNLEIKKIQIGNDWVQTSISFTGINYFNPERVTYHYRIREIDTSWININTQNFITLIGLSPGTYHLQVQAFNEDGVPSEIKELTLIFLPKWYQTWWFKLLIVLAAIGAVYGLYRIRINQLKKEQKIKTRLASDLHDDLGSTMNSVKVYTNLALMEKEKDKYLYKIKESTQEAITGIKDMIWVLDDSKGSIEDLLARVSLFASSLCEANKIQYKSEITDEARNHKLGQEERRNLYMMLKEAINNAIKYADASQVIIAISVKKGKPDISIKDDGKGFDTAKTTEGNGLKNMNRRAKEIKYHISIKSAQGKGTVINFQKI